jgi:uncharacterized RDD family membrane protein YckC
LVQNLAWQRLFARWLDFLIMTAIASIPILVFSSIDDFLEAFKAKDPGVLIPAVLFGIVYEVFFTSEFGGTPGKKIFGMEVVNDLGSRLSYGISLVRFLIKLLFLMIPGVAFILKLVSYFRLRNGKKALWDEVVGTNVVG